MTGADALLAILAVGVAVRGSYPVVGVLLVASALAGSATLFLPTQMLGSWFGMNRVHRLYDLALSRR